MSWLPWIIYLLGTPWGFRRVGGDCYRVLAPKEGEQPDPEALILAAMFGLIGALGWPVIAAWSGFRWAVERSGHSFAAALFGKPKPSRTQMERRIEQLERELGVGRPPA